jgi:hypothetical protein
MGGCVLPQPPRTDAQFLRWRSAGGVDNLRPGGKVAALWLDKLEWFSGNLTRNRRMESNLEVHAPIPVALSEVLDTLSDIVAACKSSYELHR